jgi:DNA modification methylase
MNEWELHACGNADQVSGLSSLPERSVDVVITDPPYSHKVHACSRRGVTGYKEDRGSMHTQNKRTRDLGFPALGVYERSAMALHLARVVRRWVLVFCDHESSRDWRVDLEAAGLEYVRTCIWVKIGCTPQFTGDRPAVGHECIVVAHQTRDRRPMKKRWNSGGKRGVYEHPIVLTRAGETTRVHTTQKPLTLMRELVLDFSDEGELVCDPYAGSGTTGVACRLLGRRFLGWERDVTMAAIARRRIAGARALPVEGQMEMFR